MIGYYSLSFLGHMDILLDIHSVAFLVLTGLESTHLKSLYIDYLFLPNAVTSGDSLVFDGWIPVRTNEVNLTIMLLQI